MINRWSYQHGGCWRIVTEKNSWDHAPNIDHNNVPLLRVLSCKSPNWSTDQSVINWKKRRTHRKHGQSWAFQNIIWHDDPLPNLTSSEHSSFPALRWGYDPHRVPSWMGGWRGGLPPGWADAFRLLVPFHAVSTFASDSLHLQKAYRER